ncbi:MAG: PilZ domain-containing protein [Desulfarculales bacterium]|jgi:hypothetical protein|nr:PilZ domain-containing protein [Desulfarculales bacterium]
MSDADAQNQIGQNKQRGYPLPVIGAALDLVLLNNPNEQSVILKSSLWDIRKGHLLLRQTAPPIDASSVSHDLQVSYLLPLDEQKLQRVGFTNPLRSVVDLPTNGEQIILLAVPQRITPVSLRSLLRVEPAPEVKLNASLQLEGLSLPMRAVGDISVGGAKLLHKGGLPLSQGQRLVLSLSWSGEALLLPAVLLRQEDPAENNPAALVVRFVDMPEELQQQLKSLLNRLWKRQRLNALTNAAQNMLTSNPDSFFR